MATSGYNHKKSMTNGKLTQNRVESLRTALEQGGWDNRAESISILYDTTLLPVTEDAPNDSVAELICMDHVTGTTVTFTIRNGSVRAWAFSAEHQETFEGTDISVQTLCNRERALKRIEALVSARRGR